MALCPIIVGADGVISGLRLLVYLRRRQTHLPLLHVVVGCLFQIARRESVEDWWEEILEYGVGRHDCWWSRVAGGGRNAFLARDGGLLLLPVRNTKG